MKKKQLSIINAAINCFMKNGYKDTKISDIANAGNFSQVTIYKYYPSKYHLAINSLVYLIDQGYQMFFDKISSTNQSFKDILLLITDNKKRLVNDIHPNFYQLLMTELTIDNSIVKTAYFSKKEAIYQIIYQKAIEENLINPVYSKESVFIFFDMFLHYVINNSNKEQLAITFKKEINNLINLMFYGLFGNNKIEIN